MSERVLLVRQTCSACPSQWEGQLANGHTFYIRYRWGFLSASVSAMTTTNEWEAVGGPQVIGIHHGDGLSGVMDDETMRRLTAPAFDWGSATVEDDAL